MQQRRYHGLDLGRALFMILGLFYHASLVYKPGFQWAVGYAERSKLFTLISIVIHDFRMQAFFMIAGFFFVLVSSRKGIQFCIYDRLIRIGVPLLTMIFVASLMVSSGQLESISAYVPGLPQTGWIEHLWFLKALLIYYAFSWVGYPLRKLSNKFVVWIGVLLIVPLLAYSAKTAVPSMFLFGVSMDMIVYYFPSYIAGMWLFYVKDQLDEIFEVRVSIAVVAFYFIVTFVLLHYELLGKGHLWVDVLKAVSGMSLAFGAVGLAYLWRRPSKMVQALVQSSYTIYLLHQPTLFLVFLLIADWPLPAIVSYTLLVTLTFAITIGLHFGVVSKVKLLRFLFNGERPEKVFAKPVRA